MQNGPRKPNRGHQPRRSGSFNARPQQRWVPNANRPMPKGVQTARKNYERYMELARAEALAGNTVGAENYFQHAEHYFRAMNGEQETT
jgi:hypothetical protein